MRANTFVCFDCRLSFSRNQKISNPNKLPPCTTCLTQMKYCGRDFHAPKRNDLRAWKIAEQMFMMDAVHYVSHSGARLKYLSKTARQSRVNRAVQMAWAEGRIQRVIHMPGKGERRLIQSNEMWASNIYVLPIGE